MITTIKPLLRLTYKTIIAIYGILLFSLLTIISLVFFDLLTPENTFLTSSLFASLYLKLKCSVWLLLFIGFFFLILHSRYQPIYAGTSEDSLLFFVILCCVVLSSIILQPLP